MQRLDADGKGLERLRSVIQQETTMCDNSIAHHRREKEEYTALTEKLLELQKKIEHPVMVPFGSVGFMPGKLVRTNEVMVLLGDNYFVDRSVHQTAEIIDRRLKYLDDMIQGLEQQKDNAAKRLHFAEALLGKGAGDTVEIHEEYDEEKEKAARARRKEASRAAPPRVAYEEYDKILSRLNALEEEEKKQEERAKRVQTRGGKRDSDNEGEEEQKTAEPVAPKGVDPEEFRKLLARLDEEEESTDDEDEEGEELDSDEEEPETSIAEGEEEEEAEPGKEDAEDSPPKEKAREEKKKKREMVVVDEKEVVINSHAAGSGPRLKHKRSVRFKKNLESDPVQSSSVEDQTEQPSPPSRSILRNKSEESPIDQKAVEEMNNEKKTVILPAGSAFSGEVVERNKPEPAPVYEPADEPPRRISRFKLQRMQRAE